MIPLILALVVGTHSVDLSWNASATPGVLYRVYRAPVGKPFVQVKQGIKTLYWTNEKLRADKTFCYVVTAYNSDGESEPSNEVCVTTGS